MAALMYLEGVSLRISWCWWDSLFGWLALAKLDGTRVGSTVKPSVGIDSERLTVKLFELCGPLDGLEQR